MKFLTCIKLVVPVLFISACTTKPQEPAESDKKPLATGVVVLSKDKQEMMGVQTGSVQRKAVNIHFSANGKVVVLSQNREMVTARINGTVQRILVLEGQQVNKGQPLMEISSSDYIRLQEDYLHAKAEIGYLKSDYERQRKLKEADISASKDVQLAESKYLTCVTQLRSAEARLKYLGVDAQNMVINEQMQLSSVFTVRAAISGYLLRLPVNLGMTVNQDMELAHIVNLDHYHADVFVYEKDINKVHEGQEVQLQFTNKSLPQVKGKVEFISRGIDAQTHTIIIHVVFETLHKEVLPDMTLKAEFNTTLSDQLTLPGSAFLHDDDKHFVYYTLPAHPDRFLRTEAKVISSDEHETAFTLVSAVAEGAMFVIKGALLIDSEAHKSEMEEE